MKTELENIFHELFACRELQSLLDCAEKYLRSPVVLADLTLQVIAVTARPDITDSRWRGIEDEGMIPSDILNHTKYRLSFRNQVTVEAQDKQGLIILRRAIADEGKLIGFLMSPCHGGDPTQEERDLFDLLADFCCLRMRKEQRYSEYPENIQSFFVADLLSGLLTDETLIRDRCDFFGWHVRKPYRVFSVKSRELVAYPEVNRLALVLQNRFPEATVFQYGDRIKMILSAHEGAAMEDLQIQELRDAFGEMSLSAGISEIAYRLSNLSVRNKQAEKALELGELFKSRDELSFYEKYSIYHCLEICSKEINLLHCCHPALTTLERYDRQKGTELLATLHAYLESSRNLAQSAELLHLHRNSMTKRLDKIRDLTHIDLEDSETVFHLQFSYRILEYHGITVMQGSYQDWLRRSPSLRHP